MAQSPNKTILYQKATYFTCMISCWCCKATLSIRDYFLWFIIHSCLILLVICSFKFKKMLELNFRGFSCFNRTLLAVRETVSLTFCIVYVYTVYKVISPRVMFTLLHMQIVSPCLEFDQALLCLKRYNLRLWNSSRFIFARRRPGENKTGRIFICIIYSHVYWRLSNTLTSNDKPVIIVLFASLWLRYERSMKSFRHFY